MSFLRAAPDLRAPLHRTPICQRRYGYGGYRRHYGYSPYGYRRHYGYPRYGAYRGYSRPYGYGYGGVGRRWSLPYTEGYNRSGYLYEPQLLPAPISYEGDDYQ